MRTLVEKLCQIFGRAFFAFITLLSITLYLFRLLSPAVQLRYVLIRSTYLARRWEDEGGVNLYYLAGEGRGFFIEVGVDDRHGPTIVLHSFSENEPLKDYGHYIQLPSL